jgi:hypothetical protein
MQASVSSKLSLKSRGIEYLHVLSSRSIASGLVIWSSEDLREIGDEDAIQGSLDDVTYKLWAMKEQDYVMKMMATGGSLIANESRKSTSWQWIEEGVQKIKEFAYTFPFKTTSVSVMLLMTTRIFITLCLHRKILG